MIEFLLTSHAAGSSLVQFRIINAVLCAVYFAGTLNFVAYSGSIQKVNRVKGRQPETKNFWIYLEARTVTNIFLAL